MVEPRAQDGALAPIPREDGPLDELGQRRGDALLARVEPPPRALDGLGVAAFRQGRRDGGPERQPLEAERPARLASVRMAPRRERGRRGRFRGLGIAI